MKEKIVQTAGRDQLSSFAPMFAHLNDDILFGEVWNSDGIDVKTRCIVTVVSLMASGITDSALIYHLKNAKARGVTKEEIAAIITHATMYVGWRLGGLQSRKGDLERRSAGGDGKRQIPEHNLLPRRRRESLRKVFRGTKLSCAGVTGTGSGLQCDL